MSFLSQHPDAGRAGPRLPAAIRRTIRLDGGHQVFTALVQGATRPYLALVAVQLGAGPVSLAVVSSAPVSAHLFGIFFGKWMQGRPAKPWVISSLLVMRLTFAAIGLITLPPAIAGLALVGYVAGSCYSMANVAMTQKLYPVEVRGRIMGLLRMIGAMSLLAVTFAAGWAIDRWGHRPVFLAAGLAGVAGLAATYLRIREPVDEPGQSRPSPPLSEALAPALRDRDYRRLLGALFVLQSGLFLMAPALPLMQVRELGFTAVDIGLLATVRSLALLVCHPVVGLLVDRVGPHRVFSATAVIYVVEPLVYLAAPSLGIAAIGAACTGFGDSALDISFWNLVMAVPREEVPGYSGLHMTLAGIRGVIAPLVGSWILAVAGFGPVFAMAAALVAAAAFLLVFHRPELRRRPHGED